MVQIPSDDQDILSLAKVNAVLRDIHRYVPQLLPEAYSIELCGLNYAISTKQG